MDISDDAAWSPRSLGVLERFGIACDHEMLGNERTARAGRGLTGSGTTPSAQMHSDWTTAYVTGASGSGKSTLIREIVARERSSDSGLLIIDASEIERTLEHDSRRVIDLFEGSSINETLGLLASAGLGEASLALRSSDLLSAGERDRLVLARAMELAITHVRAGSDFGVRFPADKRALIVIDEFTSRLDRLSARCVAHTLSGWARRVAREASPDAIRLLLASGHDDIIEPLDPDALVRVDGTWGKGRGESDSGQRISVVRPPRPSALSPRPCSPTITIEPGTLSAYRELAHLHYRAGPPALVCRVLIARVPGLDGPAGVLTVSMPTLNGVHRELAWPGRYSSGDKRRDTRRLNDEVRCISRVIVHPRVRGIGVARDLVRAYLVDAITPHTEARSAMGAMTRFFESAGMTAHALAPSPRDARLLDALDAWRTGRLLFRAGAGVPGESEPTSIVDVTRFVRTLREGISGCDDRHWRALIRRELVRWARSSRASAGVAVRASTGSRQHRERVLVDPTSEQIEQIVRCAIRTALTPQVAYTHSCAR